MAALVVALSVLAIMASVAMPLWSTALRREREAELVFRGEQYAHAIALYQRRFAGTYPPSLDVLVKGKFLRRAYEDPITREPFDLVYAGAPTGGGRQGGAGSPATPVGRGGIQGVMSRSDQESLMQYDGRSRYNEWVFVVTVATTQAGEQGNGTTAPGRVGGGRGTFPQGRRGGSVPTPISPGGRSGQ